MNTLQRTTCSMCGAPLIPAPRDRSVKWCAHCDQPCLDVRCPLGPCEYKRRPKP